MKLKPQGVSPHEFWVIVHSLGLDAHAIAAEAVVASRSIKKQSSQRNDCPHLTELHDRWYAGLESGNPDWGVYASQWYLAEAWACWDVYSRKYLQLIAQTLLERIGKVECVVDLGCGVGLTTAMLASIFPNAKVFGTNLDGTPQTQVAKELAKRFGFSVVPTPADVGRNADVVIASEYFEHLPDPVGHVREVVEALKPRVIIAANTFNQLSIGHFNHYTVGGATVEASKVGKLWSREMRGLGYEKQKTGFWNDRPSFWSNAGVDKLVEEPKTSKPVTTKPRVSKSSTGLGNLRPWIWAVELVRGCNLACWHCSVRVLPKEPQFMTLDTWGALCEVVERNSPGRRLEFGQAGEPSLHPQFLEVLRTVRKVSPSTQVQVFSNGLNLLNGNYSFRELFDAGAHCVYVDMYSPFEKFQKLAEESGAEWYHYNRAGVGNTKKRAYTYYGDPKLRLIILQDSPIDRLRWRKMARLSTFLNHIDWKAAMPFGLVPVRESIKRRCNLPMRFSTVTYEGDYTFCCIDFLGEAAGQMGNVNDGPEVFEQFWMGEQMQAIRRRLLHADRAGVPYCSRCNCAFSKCDWTHIWPAETFDRYRNANGVWTSMPESDDEVFAASWAKARAQAIPSMEEEVEALRTSNRRLIINTREMACKMLKKSKPTGWRFATPVR